MDTQDEIWKDIPGHEGRYQVSNMGRVKNSRGLFLRGQITNSGYRVHQLAANGTRTVALAHRLVAFAFVDGYAPGTEVNHLDGDKQNNNAVNLEWATRRENMQHAKRHGLLRPWRKPVIGTNIQTGQRVQFASQMAAEKWCSPTGKKSSAVHHCLVGQKKSAYGFRWERA
jgi:hypothetical protein